MTSWCRAHEKQLPKPGEAAYFVHLHLDTVCEDGPHPYSSDLRLYRAEGKPRPMLVLTASVGRQRSRRWFLVVPITTKGLDEQGRLRDNHKVIGPCLDPGKDSYVKLTLLHLPENMLHAAAGRSPVVKPCDPFALQNVTKIVQHMALGGSKAITSGQDE